MLWLIEPSPVEPSPGHINGHRLRQMAREQPLEKLQPKCRIIIIHFTSLGPGLASKGPSPICCPRHALKWPNSLHVKTKYLIKSRLHLYYFKLKNSVKVTYIQIHLRCTGLNLHSSSGQPIINISHLLVVEEPSMVGCCVEFAFVLVMREIEIIWRMDGKILHSQKFPRENGTTAASVETLCSRTTLYLNRQHHRKKLQCFVGDELNASAHVNVNVSCKSYATQN